MKVKVFKFAVIIAALLAGACGDLEKMKNLPEGFTVKCNPNPVEVHADKVKANIEGTIPGKYFNKKATVAITPYVVYDGGELALAPKMLQGEPARVPPPASDHSPPPSSSPAAASTLLSFFSSFYIFGFSAQTYPQPPLKTIQKKKRTEICTFLIQILTFLSG